MKCLVCHAMLLFMLGPTVASGQVNYYGPNFGASTVGGSYARGVGNVMQAQGQRNLSNSQAAINAQSAYSMAIDNSVKATNAYYDKKDIYNQHMQPVRYERAQDAAAYVAKNSIPPVTAEEFDRTTGKINWPKLLQQSSYDQYRNPLDKLFQDRAKAGALSGDDYMAAKNASKAWRVLLAKQTNEYPVEILHQLIRFILTIEREMDDNLS